MQYKNGYVYIQDKKLEEQLGIKIPKEFPRWRINQIKRINFIWWICTGEIIKYPEFISHKNKNKTDDRFENLEKTRHKFEMTEEEKKLHYANLSQKFSGKLMHPVTDNMRKAVSLANKGKIMSEETKEKLKLSLQKAIQEGRKEIRYGKDNPAWRGGLLRRDYIYIKRRVVKESYPNLPDNFPVMSIRKKDDYIKRANLVWWINTGEVIRFPPNFLHHKNEDKYDDKFENLEKTNKKKHAQEHAKEWNSHKKKKMALSV